MIIKMARNQILLGNQRIAIFYFSGLCFWIRLFCRIDFTSGNIRCNLSAINVTDEKAK